MRFKVVGLEHLGLNPYCWRKALASF